ncbi:MAG: CAP domain-containing protein [Saprospiraceae bacterium]
MNYRYPLYALLTLLLLAACDGPPTGERIGPDFEPPECNRDFSGERTGVTDRDMLGHINELRTKGCTCGSSYLPPVPPLRLSAQLTRIAKGHAADMRAQGEITHTSTNGDNPLERVRAAGFPAALVGENVGWWILTEQEMTEVWIRDASACARMLSPDFQYFGGGRVETWWVQVFASRE